MKSSQPLVELRACLVQLERMIERAKRFEREYRNRERVLPPGSPVGVESLKHVISFPELRSLDLLCVDAIKRWLPDREDLVEKWPVYGEKGVDGPEAVVMGLMSKRALVENALALLESSQDGGTIGTDSEYSTPEGYAKLAESVEKFFADSVRECGVYDRNVFLMTRFVPGNSTLARIDELIRETLRSFGLSGHRADDRCYPSDRNLWDNVCTYMVGCKYGIAVLEDVIAEEFNPNVAIEYGFMRGLGKPTLLLKERRFHPRADILGTLWEPFNILELDESIPRAMNSWVADLEVDK